MPDRITQQHRIILVHIFHNAVDDGTHIGVILFLISPSARVIGQICFGIGFFRHNFVEVCIQNVCCLLRYLFRGSGGGK